MHLIRGSGFLAGLAFLALVAGGGCGGDDNPENPVGDAGEMTVDEFEGAADAMTKTMGDVRNMFTLPGGGPGCLSISASGDTDADGLPDSTTFTLSETGCRFEGGNIWGTTSGTIRVTDAGTGIDCLVTLTNLAATLGQLDPPRTVTRVSNGTRSITGTTTAASLTQNVTMNYTISGGVAATVVHRWSATFTVAAGSPPLMSLAGQPVGEAMVGGAFDWKYGGRLRRFVFTTVTPLQWAAGCDSPFPSAGEIRGAITLGTVTGYVRIVYPGCGQDPEVDFIRL